MTTDSLAWARALAALRDAGIVTRYALAGAQAAVVWDEAIATQDVDIVVALPSMGFDALGPIYAWARAEGHRIEGEHIWIEGTPVQFLPVYSPLVADAWEHAIPVTLAPGVEVPVFSPEHLAAIWLTPPADTAVRRERAARLRALPTFDVDKFARLLAARDRTWERKAQFHAARRSQPVVDKLGAALALWRKQ